MFRECLTSILACVKHLILVITAHVLFVCANPGCTKKVALKMMHSKVLQNTLNPVTSSPVGTNFAKTISPSNSKTCTCFPIDANSIVFVHLFSEVTQSNLNICRFAGIVGNRLSPRSSRSIDFKVSKY